MKGREDLRGRERRAHRRRRRWLRGLVVLGAATTAITAYRNRKLAENRARYRLETDNVQEPDPRPSQK